MERMRQNEKACFGIKCSGIFSYAGFRGADFCNEE